MKAVPRLHNATLKEFRACYYGASPCILTGLLDMRSFEWILNNEVQKGVKEVGVARSQEQTELLTPPLEVNYVSQYFSTRSMVPLVDTVRGILSGGIRGQARCEPSYFLGSHQVPSLLQQRQVKIVGDNSVVFVTARGLRTALHSDVDHSLLLHLGGRKRFVVIKPSDSDRDPAKLRHLMTYRERSGTIQSLYLEKGGDVVMNAMPKMVDFLNPGEALYIPKRWLHDVESLEPSLSIGVRFSL